MARVCYVGKEFDDDVMWIVEQADSICHRYQQQGFDLTLRQLYYVFVSGDLFPDDRTWSWNGARWVRDPSGTKNAEPNYKWLGTIITDARLAGELDWDYIVDRTRELEGAGTRFSPHWEDPLAIVDGAVKSYQIDKWADQDNYVEVYVEKDALKGVLENACRPLDVPFFSCRGYTSISSIRSAATRIGEKIKDGRAATIVHLGDHDPSGIDMTRDVEARLSLFVAQDLDYEIPISDRAYKNDPNYCVGAVDELVVDRVALNMDQIRRYSPPPNPAKMSDSRARDYVERYGYESWELDALEPSVLVRLITDKVKALRDPIRWNDMVERETGERAEIRSVHDRWEDVQNFLKES